ncbi:MAG: hypothetical protein IKY45_04115 [Clostridia bacterium]|nr:hypothetical protein [Clostridia bacterium]
MNKFDILLSLLAKVQEDYLGTEVSDMGGYGDRAYVEVMLDDGSKLKIDVVLEAAPKEQHDGKN